MDQEPRIDKYAKAKIEDPNPQFPKSLLKPGSDPTSTLNYTELYEEDPRRAQHLAEEIEAGAQFCRKVYRIRSIDLVKVLDQDFNGMLPIHRVSKATIGLLSDAEAIKHKHSYIDLVGTVEQVKMAEELILDKILKEYSSDCYPVILMPPTVHQYEMKITLDKVSSVIRLFRANILKLEMTSRAWIALSPPPPAGVIEKERVATIYGPYENVIKAVSLIRSAMSQPIESLEGGSYFKEPSCGEPSGSTSGTGQMGGGSSTEQDRKGKAKVVESDHIPAPTPEIRSFIDKDHHYLRVIGQLPVGPNSLGVTRELLRIRARDVDKIVGSQDLMLMSIHRASRATVAIFNDASARFHFHAYLELLGTADQIRIAELLITDAITEIPLDDGSSVPTAIMPLVICHKAMDIPFVKVAPLLGIDGTNLTRIEAESGTWIELDTSVPPADQEDCESTVNNYGSKQQVKNAMVMISAIVSEGPVLPSNEEDFGIEEIGYNEQGEKQDFAAVEDELETYYENHGREDIREMAFGEGGSGGDTAHKNSAVASGSGTQKNDEESEEKKSVSGEEPKERAESGSGAQKNVEESKDKKSAKKASKERRKKKSGKKGEQKEIVEKDGSGGETAHKDSAVTQNPLDDAPSVPTAITQLDDVPSVPTATIPLDDVPSVPSTTMPVDDVPSIPTTSGDRTDSYVSDADKVQEDRLDPPGLIALKGCSSSEAYQFLNNRWEAAMRAYEDPSTDSSEKPVMYSGSGGTEAEGSSHQIDFLSELRRAMNR